MENCKSTEKKSLMNSLNQLNIKADSLSDLSNKSSILLRKFNAPNDNQKNEQEKVSHVSDDPVQHDLIGLFNETTSRIQREIEVIGDNISQIMDMID